MASPPVSDALLKQAVDVYKKHGGYCQAARSGELPTRSDMTVRRWIDQAKKRGLYDEPPEDSEQIRENRRLRDELARVKRERDLLAREQTRHQELRSLIGNLTEKPLSPRKFKVHTRSGEKSPEIPVLFHSDTQYGEVINLEEMDGLNSFNADIGRQRLERMFSAAVDLTRNHWSGPPPKKFMYLRGGDHVSGHIHAELSETNDRTAIEAIRELAEIEAAGIELIHKELGCEVDVISVPGNHGRITLKPHSKKYTALNFDAALACLLEVHFKDSKLPVTFYAPTSGDAVFKIHNVNCLLTHGDRIGSRGGQGFIGPALTIARGAKKLKDDYASRGIFLDLICLGHFHTSLKLEYCLANGSIPGYSEYARDLRMTPRPSTQWYVTVHERRGVTSYRELQIGDPSEGSLY